MTSACREEPKTSTQWALGGPTTTSMDGDSMDDKFVQATKVEGRLLEAHNEEADPNVSS
jgi:hypothetical protein